MLAGAFAGLLQAAHLPLWVDASSLASVSPGAIFGYAVLWSIVHAIRAARWQLLLRPVHPAPMKQVLSAAFLGFAAIVLFPLRTGEMVRPVLIRKKDQLSGWAALGTIGAERIIDGLLLTIMLTAAMALTPPLDPLPESIGDLQISVKLVPRATLSCLLAFACAFALMFSFYFARSWTQRILERLLSLVSPKLAEYVCSRLVKLTTGLDFMKDWRTNLAFISVSLVYWWLNAYANLVLAQGCGLTNFGFGEACVVTGVLALGILIPNAPGFFGAFQFAIYAALAMYYPREVVLGEGPRYVFLVYLLQMGITAAGAAMGIALQRSARRTT